MADNLNNQTKNKFIAPGIILFVIIGYLAVNISGLFVPVVENASKYAQVGREIIDNHDWINLTIAHEPYDQKPPLLFWISALSFSFFGFSVIAYKIPVLLLSFVGIFSTFKLGKLFYGKRVGALAAFFWATSLGYFYFHNDIHTDTILVNFVVLAIWQLALFFKEKKWHQYLIGVFSLGFAMLAKGPVGLAIPVFAIGTHLLARKQYKEIFHLRWLLAAFIVSIVISPALIGLYKQFGIEGIKFYFWTNNVGRVTGSYRASNSNATFYLHNLILVGIPWFVFIYAGLVFEIRRFVLKLKRKESVSDSEEAINLGGSILFLIVLTLASQKNPHYLLAILPLIMILAAKWAIEIFGNSLFVKIKKVISSVNLIFPVLLLAVIGLFVFWFYPETRAAFWIFVIASILFILYGYIKFKGLIKQVLLLFSVQVLFFICLNTSILPSMFNYFSVFKACEIFNAEAGADEVLHSYRLRYWSLFMYSKNYGDWIRDEEKMKLVLEKGNSWVFTDEFGFNELKKRDAVFTMKGQFNHRNLTGQTIQFLNPATRSQHLSKFYLIKLE